MKNKKYICECCLHPVIVPKERIIDAEGGEIYCEECVDGDGVFRKGSAK